MELVSRQRRRLPFGLVENAAKYDGAVAVPLRWAMMGEEENPVTAVHRCKAAGFWKQLAGTVSNFAPVAALAAKNALPDQRRVIFERIETALRAINWASKQYYDGQTPREAWDPMETAVNVASGNKYAAMAGGNTGWLTLAINPHRSGLLVLTPASDKHPQGRELSKPNLPSGAVVQRTRFGAYTKVLAAAGDSWGAAWDTETGDTLRSLKLPEVKIPVLAWNSDGTKLAIGQMQGTVAYVYDIFGGGRTVVEFPHKISRLYFDELGRLTDENPSHRAGAR